jgi:ribosome-binding protein aMBF1 (putative translation factor)
MIKNERQYAVTRTQAQKFARALEELRTRASQKGASRDRLLRAEEDALRSQLADLRAQLEEYEGLRSRRPTRLNIATLEELPRALIQARIVSGLSQKELAERLHLKEQQIQRYEATDYASASLARLIQVSRALGLKVRASARTTGAGKPAD